MKVWKSALCVLAMAALDGCSMSPPPHPLPTPPSAVRAFGFTMWKVPGQAVTAADHPNIWFEIDDGSRDPKSCGFRTDGGIICVLTEDWPVPHGIQLHVQDVEGFKSFDLWLPLTEDVLHTGLGDLTLVAEAPARPGRPGVTRLAGRTYVDDAGPNLAVGTSLFWAPWGMLHDRDRTQENLQCAAGLIRPDQCGAGVDFIRAICTLGPSGGWDDRFMGAPDCLSSFALTTDISYDNYKLKIFWTVFGGVDTVNRQQREDLVRSLAGQTAGRAEKIQGFEIANEGWQNGFGGDAGRDELQRLADILRTVHPIVALTAPGEVPSGIEELYGKSSATLITAHLERNITGTGGRFRPIRQCREMVGNTGSRAWQNNEPIGPQSSVAEDSDPDRMVLAAAYTWLCNGAGYVYHTGAGIRGGGAADRARGRSANLWEVPGYAASVNGFAAVKAILPNDLANWTWHNNNPNFPFYPFKTDVLTDEKHVSRAFMAESAGRFVIIPLDVMQATPFEAKRAMSFDVYDPRTGTAIEHVELAAGQTYILTPRPGAVFRGVFR